MKRFLVLFSLLAIYCDIAFAQTEATADTLRQATGDIPPTGDQLLPDGVKSYDGFLIDMNNLVKLPTPDMNKTYKIVIPDASKDYNWIFRLNPDVTYSSGLSNMFSLSGSPYFSSNPFGIMGFGFGNTTDNLQMGSFRLKNGWRVPNPSALPWQKNNFKGAFELKSQDGSFGIRIEVQKGRENPFFY